jgi:spore maturation protein CgeB
MFKSKGVIDWENEIQENALEKDHHEKIQKMIQMDFSKDVILRLGYTEEEYAKAEKELLTTV